MLNSLTNIAAKTELWHHIRIRRKYESGFIQSNGPVTRAPVTGTKNDNDKNARPLWLNERILHGAFIGACVTGP